MAIAIERTIVRWLTGSPGGKKATRQVLSADKYTPSDACGKVN